jgi:RNA polymerase sigma-70 factor (ECF subfamily)
MLHKRYSGKVFGKCISILKSESLAEDATQDVMVKILLNMSRFSGKSKFSTWLYSITYNYCIDFLRRKKKDPCVFVEDLIENSDTAEEVSDTFLLETNVNMLKVVLEEIPAVDKSVLLMKYQDDLSIKEIGEILEKSDSAIKMQLKRAKQKFRNMYTERFPDK